MLNSIITCLLFLLMVWISVHDIRTHTIENYIHPYIMAAGFFINNIELSERLAGAVICFLPLFVVNIISKNGIGMGDVKLVGSMGFVLGVYGGLFSAVCGLTIMLLTAGVYQKIKKINKAIPLAPFLCGGFALCLLII